VLLDHHAAPLALTRQQVHEPLPGLDFLGIQNLGKIPNFAIFLTYDMVDRDALEIIFWYCTIHREMFFMSRANEACPPASYFLPNPAPA
jgi:hypothetical protein